jgi:methyl-accepting chemotaxis protein
VAAEVGKLAHMSNQAAHEVSSVLAHSIAQVRETVARTQTEVTQQAQENRERMERGSRTVEQCATILQSLVQASQSTTQALGAISTASEEQGRGVAGITTAMTQLDKVTQENAAAARNSAAISERLKLQSQQLTRVMQELQTTVQGMKAGRLSAAKAESPPASQDQAETLDIVQTERVA